MLSIHHFFQCIDHSSILIYDIFQRIKSLFFLIEFLAEFSFLSFLSMLEKKKRKGESRKNLAKKNRPHKLWFHLYKINFNLDLTYCLSFCDFHNFSELDKK